MDGRSVGRTHVSNTHPSATTAADPTDARRQCVTPTCGARDDVVIVVGVGIGGASGAAATGRRCGTSGDRRRERIGDANGDADGDDDAVWGGDGRDDGGDVSAHGARGDVIVLLSHRGV